ncbi:carbon-nitrogen hydrolase [Phycomyces nitens]|nr:carbon-nitrogen hydrolase [Phycomyces nitens]
MTMRIAAVQFHIDHKDKESNWPRVEQYMAKAAEQKMDLIVFPEYFIGGPGKRSSIQGAAERFSALARKYDMDLVPGTVIERDPTDGNLYNCSYYIDKSGKILLEYRKYHLWHPERTYLSNGQHGFNTAVNRFGLTFGLCVCWDIAFPEVFRHMTQEKNAQLVITPAYWSMEDAGEVGLKHDLQSEVKLLNHLCVTRAFENEICMVFCNGAAESQVERQQPYGKLAGRTQITVPFKGPVAHCDHDREEMIMAEIDVKQLTDDAEEAYRIRKDWKEGRVFGGSKKEEVETIT